MNSKKTVRAVTNLTKKQMDDLKKECEDRGLSVASVLRERIVKKIN